VKGTHRPTCYPSPVPPIAAPEVPQAFGATVAAVSVLALAIGAVQPSLRAMRKVEPRMRAARDACVAALGEARVVERAVAEARAAGAACDMTHEDRVAELYRCRQALQGYRAAVRGAAVAMTNAIRTVEGLRDIEQVVAMTRRGWGKEWREALETMRRLSSEFDTMFKMEEFAALERQTDQLYARAVEEEVERALLVADDLKGRVPADAESVMATLRSMVEFCEAHGISLEEADPA
jgi:hypothetical protein